MKFHFRITRSRCDDHIEVFDGDTLTAAYAAACAKHRGARVTAVKSDMRVYSALWPALYRRPVSP